VEDVMPDMVVGAGARRPNPALQPLAFLVGDWSTTGSHPAFPGEKLPGMTSFGWAEGGAYLVMRSQTVHQDFPDGVAIFSSDGALGTVMMSWFDERGISRLCPVSVGEKSVTWRHDDPAFMQRVTITSDGDRMVSEGEMARDGGPWGPDLSQIFVRR
jgi:hypothetical protein